LLLHAAALLEMVLRDPPALAEQPGVPYLGVVEKSPVLCRRRRVDDAVEDVFHDVESDALHDAFSFTE
jgi:hypothetical protein